MMMRLFGVALIGAGLLASPALADAKFDVCVRKLCTSTDQEDCWIKAGSAMCNRDQVACKTLPDHAFAKVKRKVGRRWEVETKFGNGWVSDRMMLIDGSKCSA